MDAGAPLAAVLGLGFLLGLQHATDADHVAAVSTLASRQRSVVASALLGSFWGAGHTAALLVAGGIAMALRLTISPAVAEALEALVGLMLVGLGGQVILQAPRAIAAHRHVHAPGAHGHEHAHVHVGAAAAHDHVHLTRLGARPFLVGLVHGLAGSAALTLMVASTVGSPLGGVLYLAMFGAGSTVGMLLLSGLIGLPFVLASRRSARLHLLVRLTAGAASLVVGIALVAEMV